MFKFIKKREIYKKLNKIGEEMNMLRLDIRQQETLIKELSKMRGIRGANEFIITCELNVLDDELKLMALGFEEDKLIRELSEL